MDPATPDVGKRKILAEHLKESIDVLELKVSPFLVAQGQSRMLMLFPIGR